MSNTLSLLPRMSEKSYEESLATNTYVFKVPKSANKLQISTAVTEQYAVGVASVRTVIVKGKKARSIRLGKYRRNVMGIRSDYKKAYVTLKDGDKIPVFATIEEAEAKEAKAAEKAAKKAKESK